MSTLETKMNKLSGHRKRLKKRYAQLEGKKLQGYELLELLLFYVKRRGDTQVIAKELLTNFNSFAKILNASPSQLKQIEGVGEETVLFFKILFDFYENIFLGSDFTKPLPVLNNPHSVLNFCRFNTGFKDKEVFRILYLNRNGELIKQDCYEGTIDRVHVYPQEIAKSALERGASSVILVHNHLSKEVKPSYEDIEVTNKIMKALELINVSVLEHLIVREFDFFSFRENNLLK